MLPRFIDIAPDLAVLPQNVGAVKNLGEGKSAVFLVGQSAADGGFTVEVDWMDVVGELNDELERAAEAEAEAEEDDDANTGDEDAA